MGERAGSGNPAASMMSHEAGHAGGASGGISAMLKDPKRMAELAKGLGSLGSPTALPSSPSMAPMDMGGGAGAANGDPSALAAAMQMAQQRQMMPARPSIFDRVNRFGGGF